MKKTLIGFMGAVALVLSSCHPQGGDSVSASHQQTLPRELNASLEKPFDSVFLAVNGVSTSDLHTLMVLQHGKVIYEKCGMGHTLDELHMMWSATKTFTATAVGFAQQDGLLNVDTPLARYLADELPENMPAELEQLTLHHVLSMQSGWQKDSITDRIRGGEQFDAVRFVLGRGFTHQPGTHWRYNNQDSYIAGVVVQKLTGRTLEQYLQDKLFSKIGIDTLVWEHDARGFNTGGWGMHLSAESMAKFGQFLLQKGVWNGEQLLDSAWITRATSVQAMQDNPTGSDWGCGYCYQCWPCHIPGSYRADGMWGQYIVVLPDKDAVVVMTTLCTERSVQMDAVWNHIYPHL